MSNRPHVKLALLEFYLLDVVTSRFHAQGCIDAFDFFCIVIWKANRAKSKIAKRLMKDREEGLDQIVQQLTTKIYRAPTHRDRLHILMKEYGFLFPMASAILTVLYPDDFTVYDVRVCEQLKDFTELAGATSMDSIWSGYEAYLQAVIKYNPAQLCLRDRDRELWGRSFARQLEKQIDERFCTSAQNADA